MFTYSKDLTWNVLKFSKIYLLIADHSFQIFLKVIGYITIIFLYYGYIFFKDIGYIITSTNSHIKCIVCICVSFLYICLTSETLHYPWIPSYPWIF